MDAWGELDIKESNVSALSHVINWERARDTGSESRFSLKHRYNEAGMCSILSNI
jgi:hypothetical protein